MEKYIKLLEEALPHYHISATVRLADRSVIIRILHGSSCIERVVKIVFLEDRNFFMDFVKNLERDLASTEGFDTDVRVGILQRLGSRKMNNFNE